MTPLRRSGFTLIELMIALMISGLVLSAAYRLLTGNQRFYRAQSQIVDVQSTIRSIGVILPGEFREISSAEGDINAMSDTSIDFNAMRGFGVICATPNTSNGDIILRRSLLFAYRAIDPSRSGAFVYRDGDTTRSSDDRWVKASITSVDGQDCADGTSGLRVRLSVVGGNNQLGQVYPGAPVRIFERVEYRLYTTSGQTWLGTQTMSGGAWPGLAAVAGPLVPGNGVQFLYYTAAGSTTSTPANVEMIEIVARGRSAQPIQVPGRAAGQFQDSLRVRVYLRNN